MTTSNKKIEVHFDDSADQIKWCVPLKDEVFSFLMAKGKSKFNKVFGDGSLFSPLLFGKFFDPSDAFPLWEFESDALLSNLRCPGQSKVDWFQTETNYVLKAELPISGTEKDDLQVCVEYEKVVQISGLWRHENESNEYNWRNNQWWEHGYVRRLELPENADWRKLEAYMTDDIFLEIKIPKRM